VHAEDEPLIMIENGRECGGEKYEFTMNIGREAMANPVVP
jgi:hypothetical protein